MTNSLTITITESIDEVGFFYDIYDCEARDLTDDDMDDTHLMDGGHCTSDDITVALEMATDHAKSLLKKDSK